MALALYKMVRKLFSSIGEVAIHEAYPGLETASDEELFEVINMSISTVWHASCTARMGQRAWG